MLSASAKAADCWSKEDELCPAECFMSIDKWLQILKIKSGDHSKPPQPPQQPWPNLPLSHRSCLWAACNIWPVHEIYHNNLRLESLKDRQLSGSGLTLLPRLAHLSRSILWSDLSVWCTNQQTTSVSIQIHLRLAAINWKFTAGIQPLATTTANNNIIIIQRPVLQRKFKKLRVSPATLRWFTPSFETLGSIFMNLQVQGAQVGGVIFFCNL